MIKTYKNSATRQFAEQGKSKFPGLDADQAHEMFAVLNAISSIKQVSPLKSVGLHQLKGGRKGQWAITVNGPWRICFTFKDGNAYDVEIVDYH